MNSKKREKRNNMKKQIFVTGKIDIALIEGISKDESLKGDFEIAKEKINGKEYAIITFNKYSYIYIPVISFGIPILIMLASMLRLLFSPLSYIIYTTQLSEKVYHRIKENERQQKSLNE